MHWVLAAPEVSVYFPGITYSSYLLLLIDSQNAQLREAEPISDLIRRLKTDVFDLDADNPGTYVQPSSSKLEYTPQWLAQGVSSVQCSNGFGAGKPNRCAFCLVHRVWPQAWHYLVPALQTMEPDQLLAK